MVLTCCCCCCCCRFRCHLQRLEELKRSQEEELEERLDAGVKRILAANRRLAEELRLHVTVRAWRLAGHSNAQCVHESHIVANFSPLHYQ